MKGSKIRSRTFWLAAVWTAFIPLGMFISAYMSSNGVAPTFMTQLIVASGGVVSLYVGKRAVDNATYNIKEGKTNGKRE